MPRLARAAVLLLVLAVCTGATSAGLAVHREVLPNGIVLLVVERPTVPIVAALASFRGGSAFDPATAHGLANLTAELLTRGTAQRTGPELDQAIELVGGSLEADAGRDAITVSLSVLKKDLTLGLDLMREVVRTPAFPAEEVSRKVKEIQAAIRRSEEDPDTVAGRALVEVIYPDHPYGHPVGGTEESVGKLTREQVLQHYRGHLRPDNMIVAVVGAITVAEARTQITARFGDWVGPGTPLPTVPRATGMSPPGTRTIKRELTQATVYMGRQAIRQDDPDYYPLSVGSYILGGGSASRLYTRVREQSGLAYSIYSYVSPGRYGSSFVVAFQTRVNEAPKAVEITREELERITREPVSDAELQLAKSYLIGSFPLRLDTTAKVAAFVLAVEEQGLGLDYAERYKERIAAVTAADVQRAARRFLAPPTFSTITVGSAP
jgi:zinc protease